MSENLKKYNKQQIAEIFDCQPLKRKRKSRRQFSRGNFIEGFSIF